MTTALKSIFRPRSFSEGDGTIDGLRRTMKDALGENGVVGGSGDAEPVDDPLGVNQHDHAQEDSIPANNGETNMPSSVSSISCPCQT